jgi:hypothetical protein
MKYSAEQIVAKIRGPLWSMTANRTANRMDNAERRRRLTKSSPTKTDRERT